ncbi:DUF305 domain-containing protein [Micromonospora sp. WMMD1082]|uniref:DUF305 domain-containing protein n=1 Tax=Micromonospora sp. WMMD1082 TaxID=3016104 RepID=UPI0024170E90|nr:DUF305 domain-containing protein [Micromonospora sp. WMMD1082]MDG4792310.1 DUF305 domain-containing protein [Micromonospora sp. WMMD1082]
MEPGLTSGGCGRARPHLPPALTRRAVRPLPALPAVPALLAVLLAAGCGGAPARSPEGSPPGGTPPAVAAGTTPAATTEMTGIDLLFLSMMAGHTEQTLEIVRLVRDRLADNELQTLVAAVEVTESDELTTAHAWLAQAGRSARADDHAGHGSGPEQLARLRDAPAGQVDRVLIEVLSAHQQAAADLARAHLAAGIDERVRDLARRVEQSRTAQVALLADRPAAKG